MSGLEPQDQLALRGSLLPIIVISAHGDVPQVVRALKSGAVDFLRKPYSGIELLERVREALAKAVQMRAAAAERAAAAARLERLSAREREVAELLAAGGSGPQIAEKLGLSRKTVDVHRANILLKTRTESIVELMHLVQSAASPGMPPPKPFP
jgi:FixJ family two-component response regulator